MRRTNLASSWSAWRIEGTLREFASFEPVNVWFDYPCHEPDITGSLADLKVEGEIPSPEERRRKGTENAKARRVSQQRDKIRLMRDAIAACKSEGVEPTRPAVLERIGELDGEPVTRDMLKN